MRTTTDTSQVNDTRSTFMMTGRSSSCAWGGKGILTGRERSRISGGVVILVLPGEPHGFESDEEDPLEYVCIDCRTSPKP
jgi:hypothetical protein